MIAFRAETVVGPGGLFVGDGGPPTQITTDGLGSFNDPLINNAGHLAFIENGGLSLYAGSAPARVIGSGDPLFGSHVSQIKFDLGRVAYGLNDYDQIAFAYELDDGRQGIAVATPVSEPSSIVLMLLGGAALAVLRWRRKFS